MSLIATVGEVEWRRTKRVYKTITRKDFKSYPEKDKTYEFCWKGRLMGPGDRGFWKYETVNFICFFFNLKFPFFCWCKKQPVVDVCSYTKVVYIWILNVLCTEEIMSITKKLKSILMDLRRIFWPCFQVEITCG